MPGGYGFNAKHAFILGRHHLEPNPRMIEAKARGELPTNADVQPLSRFLTASIQGMRLIGKANPDRAMLRDVAKTMLRCLDGHLPWRAQWIRNQG